MKNWFNYLKAGLTRTLPTDRISIEAGGDKTRSNLQNLRPYFARHWRKGVIGAGLVLFVSLLAFPQPMLFRYLVDDEMPAG